MKFLGFKYETLVKVTDLNFFFKYKCLSKDLLASIVLICETQGQTFSLTKNEVKDHPRNDATTNQYLRSVFIDSFILRKSIRSLQNCGTLLHELY